MGSSGWFTTCLIALEIAPKDYLQMEKEVSRYQFPDANEMFAAALKWGRVWAECQEQGDEFVFCKGNKQVPLDLSHDMMWLGYGRTLRLELVLTLEDYESYDLISQQAGCSEKLPERIFALYLYVLSLMENGWESYIKKGDDLQFIPNDLSVPF